MALLSHIMGISAVRVTLTGANIVEPVASPNDSNPGIIFRTDGTTDKTGILAQINVLTDWIIPNSSANSAYEVRFTNFAGDPFTVEAAAEDVWIDLSSDRQWRLDNTGLGTDNCSCDFEIRFGSSGPAIASGGYTFEAEVAL